LHREDNLHVDLGIRIRHSMPLLRSLVFSGCGAL
jgi:hypothetical protein